MAKLKADVRDYGWHCLSVSPRVGEEGEHFTYSIGLVESFAHPEIMIFGLGSELSHGILTDCVEKIRDGQRFEPDVQYAEVIGGDYQVVFKAVKPDSLPEYFGAACRYYGDRPFPALIMFWPNKAHRFPWQEPDFASQREALDIVQL